MNTSTPAWDVCTSLVHEHRLTEAKLDALETALAAWPLEAGTPEPGLKQGLLAQMEALTAEMNVHFACEERVLFPVLEHYHPMVLMEAEHEMILDLRDRLQTALVEDDSAAVAIGREFARELRDHIVREDAGIFPQAERELSRDEKDQVIAGMDALRHAAVANPQEVVPASAHRELHVLDATEANPRPDRASFARTWQNWPGQAAIKQLWLQAGETSGHWSPKCLLLVCTAGEATLTSDEQEIALKPGITVALDARMCHNIQATTDTALLMVVLD